MKKTSTMKVCNMKRVLLALAALAGFGTMAVAQTYRPITNTSLIINSSYPSGNALTLQTGAGQTAYSLTLPAATPTAGYILRSDPSAATTLIWTAPLDMYEFVNGLTETGGANNTVKWGGTLTSATIINTAGANALTFYNNTAASSTVFTVGGGAGTLTFDVQGGTTLNTTGTANTAIGNATGTFELNSSALDVSTAGAMSGITTIGMNGTLTNAATSNQFILGTGTTVTITAPTPAANSVYTIPDVGTTGSFVLTTGTQTISGSKTFSSAVSITDNTASTSTSTGAIVVTGGAGIGGRLNVAGNASLEGDVTIGNASADGLTITAASVTAANLPTTGASTHSLVVSNAGALVTGSIPTIIGDHAWMVGGNTITGASATRKIGINSQASNDDALAIMTDGQDRLTISATGNSTFAGLVNVNSGVDGDLSIAETGLSRAGNIAITSTSGGVTLTKGSASATFNDDVNIARTGTSTTQAIIMDNGQLTLSTESNATPATSRAASVQISNTTPSISISATDAAGASTNQFVVSPDGTSSLAALTLGDASTAGSARIHDGSGGTEGIIVTSGLGADRTYTIDVDANASFVMTAGVQSIGGAKTFTASTVVDGDLTLGTGASATGGSLVLNDDAIGTSFTATVKAANHAASRTYTLDDISADASFVMTAGTQTVGGAKTFSGAASFGSTVDVSGATTLNGNVTVGDNASDITTMTGTIAGGTPLVFEGATANDFETSFAITDPTADRTITFPDADGTVITTGNADDLIWKVGGNTVTGGSTTRKIGINAQASNDDALALMTDGQDRLTIAATGNSTFSGQVAINSGVDADLTLTEAGLSRIGSIAVTSTAGGVSLTKGNGSITISGGDDINLQRSGTSTTQTVTMDNGSITIASEANPSTTSKSASIQISNTTPSIMFAVTNAAGTSTNSVTVSPTSTVADTDVSITATTTSTSSTTGALKVSGGAGINENLFVGGTLNATGNTSLSGTLGVTGATTLNGNVTLGDNATDVVTVTGTIAGATPLVFEGPTANAFETSFAITDPTAARTITFPDESGTVVLTAGTQTIGGAKTFSSAVSVTDNTGSTSSTTGALKVTGGAGIGENLYVGGTLNATGNTSLSGTLGVTGATTLNGNVTLGDNASDVVTVTGTVAGATPLVFEGATANDFETSFAITDPTADRTITFPDVSGTVITTGNTSDLATVTWLVGGNTITGGTTTRKIGIAAQAADDDGLAIMTDGTDRLTITSAGAATFSGTLASTGAFNANGNATLGDGGDNVSINAGTGTFEVASSGVDISTAGAVSSVTTLNMSSTLTNSATSNQIVLGTTNTTTISATAPTASLTYTIPDVGGAASFVMTAGAQTVGGAKTFSAATAVEGDLTLGTGTSATGGSLILHDDATGNSFTATVKAADHAASRTYTIPDAGATASFVMTEGTNTINGATNFNATAAFASALRFPFNRNTAGAVTIGANDFVVIQNAAAGITLPAGSAGRMLIIKNTSGATQTITANAGETCDAANLADGASITIIFNGTNWYQVGN